MRDQVLTPEPRRAAQYVRMSTDMQRYSIQNQSEAIATYALLNGIQIVRYYADEGRSGLTLRGRAGLQSLLDDVQSGQADFDTLLVYDISRWGRFQDADESAHYEHLCRTAGVRVHYCAEQFENDGSLWAAVVKSLKRAMAAEYSRELGVKVFHGQARLVRMGLKTNGPCGYGLRRLLVDQAGNAKMVLQPGELKSIASDRIVFVPGPQEEVAVVRRMFERFVAGESEQQIADDLNAQGLKTDLRRSWSKQTVRTILNSPKYVGDNVYNRRSFRLRQKRVRNSPEHWIRCDDAFPPVVSRELFENAQRRRAVRRGCLTDLEMLAKLRQLLDETGEVTVELVRSRPDVSNPYFYNHRFGSLQEALFRIGHYRENGKVSAVQRAIRLMRPKTAGEIERRLTARGCQVSIDPVTGFLVTDSGLKIGVYAGHVASTSRRPDWSFCVTEVRPDIVVAVRVDPATLTVIDYYCVEASAIGRHFSVQGDGRFRKELCYPTQARLCRHLLAVERSRNAGPGSVEAPAIASQARSYRIREM